MNSTYEQAKAILESYGYTQLKETEFVKKYVHKKYGWMSGRETDEVEVTIYLCEDGEYDGESIDILNDTLEFDEISDLQDSLTDAFNDIDGIKNELDDIDFCPEEDEENEN